MDPVRHNYRYQLSYAGKQKVGMKSLCILCLTVSETETVFDVIDGALDRCADFIGCLPFLCSPDCSGTAAEIFFRVQVDHSTTCGTRARILTVADTV